MKKSYRLLMLVLLFFYVSSNAQVFRKKIIHAGESITDSSYYLFPSFTDAVVKFKKGGELNSKMNFNLVLCQMQFLSPVNDTLVITSPADVASIQLNNTEFFYTDGYYQILASSDSVKLVVSRKVSYTPVKIGALGLPNYSGTGEQMYTSVVTGIGEKRLVMNEDVEVATRTDYMLIINNEFTKANKDAFIKAFPDQQERLQGYFKQQKVNFNKEEDLKKLFQFCLAKG